MAGPFLGVELPDKFETNSSDSAPDVSEASSAADNAPEENNGTPDKPDSRVDKPAAEAAAKPDILDLDKHERVRFKGKEWSTKDLVDSQFRHEDYTRKVQAAAEARKYADNFEADLDAVVQNPSLFRELKRIYPPSYVKVAERVLRSLQNDSGERQAPEASTPYSQRDIDPEIRNQIEELVQWKTAVDSKITEAQVARSEATLDSWYNELGSKYPDADQEIVTAKAQWQAELKEGRGEAFTKQDLEKVFKAEQERLEKRYAEKYRSQIEAQKAAAKKAQDVGAGGGVPTAPSKKPKTFKEANALIEADLAAGRLS